LKERVNSFPLAEDIEPLSKLKIEFFQKETQLVEIGNRIDDDMSALSKPVSEGFITDLAMMPG
jgi:hypothetical protein